MAKQRLFPKTETTDKHDPHENFQRLAATILKVSKADIDEREKKWREQKGKSPKT